MKRKLLVVFVIMLIAALCLSAFACKAPTDDNAGGNPSNEEDNEPSTENDDDYVLEIEGIGAEIISVTKAQIKALAQTKLVEYTKEEPCYTSDKTDEDNNPIPHWLKGVYLDDILAEYADGAVSGYYSSMVLKAEDGYENQLTQDTFSVEHGGSKMIIAYEYDGHELKPGEESGALRAVFPDQVANSWAKKLKKIIFTDAQLLPPAPTSLNFVELLGEDFDGSFQKDVTTGAGTSAYTFYGVSLAALFEAGILAAEESDKMYLNAWDYITDGTSSFYREYTNWKSYEYYSNAYLVYQYKVGDGEIQQESTAPNLDGENILKGMTVKNMLSLSVKSTALVCLDMAYERFDTDKNDTIMLSDVLGLVNMMNDKKTYTITTASDAQVQVSGDTLSSATLSKTQSGYTLNYGAESVAIKSISINK